MSDRPSETAKAPKAEASARRSAPSDPPPSSDPIQEDADDEGVDGGNEDSDDEDEENVVLPTLTPELLEFSHIKMGEFAKSFEYIQKHRSVYVPGAEDALLVAAFDAETNGQHKYAKQCVHQSLLLQYCDKLGPNGPALFFRRYVRALDDSQLCQLILALTHGI